MEHVMDEIIKEDSTEELNSEKNYNNEEENEKQKKERPTLKEEIITVHSVKRYGINDNQAIAQISAKNSKHTCEKGIFPYFLDLSNPDCSEFHRKIINIINENNIEIEPSDTNKIAFKKSEANNRVEKELKETEKYMREDYPISNDTRILIKKYRQDLKEIDTQKDYPENILWPEKPNITELSKSSDEYKSNMIRLERNKLLEETDKYMVIDSILSDNEMKEMKEYRKSLRDITLQKNFPSDIKWPEKPKCLI